MDKQIVMIASPAEFEAAMEELSSIDDVEQRHILMDIAMCKLLRTLGYGKGINIFEATPKWYT